jgi:N-acetyl sugar amidotransferase
MMITQQASAPATRSYQQCIRCVMDTTAPDISFGANGICNYCTEFLERSNHIIHEDPEDKESRLNALVARVKAAGRGKPYDCIVGVSGGVDSSWVLVQAKRLGLRPLAVHMDNGWNSELAQNNIANLVRGLGVDLYTHVIEWEEYKCLMQAFFDADVIDVELLYDNAMLAVNYRQAQKYGIQYILSGANQVTEGMHIPSGWNWFKLDGRNIHALAHKYGKVKIKTFPVIGVLNWFYIEYIKKIKWVSFPDYLPYNKFDVLNELEKNYRYKRYPFKHYESIFTRFYQGYILPRKFNVDKRLVHLATLVVSGQLTRGMALEGLRGIPYPSEQQQEEDIRYFLKKMGWTRTDLEHYLSRPEVPHSAYSSEKKLYIFMYSLGKILLPKSVRKYLKKTE